MSTLAEVAPAHARSMVCRPCTLYPRALRVIWPGVGVAVGVTVSVGVGLGAAVDVAHIAPPNHSLGDRIQRVNIVRFGYCNDRRAVRATLDIERSGVNIGRDRSVEVQLSPQACCRRTRKRSINLNAIARNMCCVPA